MTLASAAGAPRALRMTPGRWVAVALAVPVALALIGWTGFTLVSTIARGSYPFSLPVQVRDGQVAVDVNEGNVTLRQAFGATARLTGTVQYGLIRPGITESTTATGTNVGISCDGIASDCGMNATLVVPARTGVSLASYGGDVAISGWTGQLTLSTGGGNITAGNLAGTLQIYTSGGDLTGGALTGNTQISTGGGNVYADLAGTLRLDTGGGDLTSNAISGNVQISTGGGNINAGDLAGTLRLDTGGGDLTSSAMSGNVQISTEGGNVNGTSVSASQLTISSGGGDVTLVFSQPPTNLQITASGGNITVELPAGDTKYDISTPNTNGVNVSYPSSLFSSTSQHVITLNGGGGDITITQG